jgi:HD superfamily phosphohydrolase
MSTFINDRIHGSIEISSIANQIIDTLEFQRLRRISQTGVLFFVFPSATHTRFEHSIGVYHLAKLLTKNLLYDSSWDLDFKNRLIELVGIAGLIHDLGHVSFSHMFDEFAEHFPTFIKHEIRSQMIFKEICLKYKLEISEEEINLINSLVVPPKDYQKGIKLNKIEIGKWIYQIIANPINGIDVDKFDYLVRDSTICRIKTNFDFDRLIHQAKIIDNEIVFPWKLRHNIFQMYLTRYQLHQMVYNHKTVKGCEIYMLKILERLNQLENFMDKFNQISTLIRITDDLVFASNDDIIKNYLQKIYQRKFPKLIDITNNLEDLMEKIIPDKIISLKVSIGFSNDETNPLLKIKYFRDNEIVKPKINDYGLLANRKHQEIYYYHFTL